MKIEECKTCGSRLARDNPLDVCSSCARQETGPAVTAPVKPAEFWERAPIQAALQHRDIGRVVRAYRREHDPVLPQGVVGGWLGLTQGQISRIEHAKAPVHDLIKLDRWARALHIPEQLLWFRLMPQAGGDYEDAEVPVTVESTPQIDGGDETDVRRRELPKAIAGSALAIANVGSAENPVPRPAAGAIYHVGQSDIETIWEMATTFRRLDNRFGGGHAQGALTTYLDHNVLPLLRDGGARSDVERRLVRAVAELHHLAGWMAADTGHYGFAKPYLREALRYARASGDHAYVAEVLAGMSHQESYRRNGRRAIELAQAATASARTAGLRSLMAEASVMEAHGHALEGNVRLCREALRRSEQQFDSGEREDRPGWFQYFDLAYLSAKFGHVFQALGQPTLAERYAIRSLQMSDGYDRGRLFNTVLLASIYADKRELDMAISLGHKAFSMARNIRSARTVSYLHGLARRLENHVDYPPANEFVQRVRTLRMNTAD